MLFLAHLSEDPLALIKQIKAAGMAASMALSPDTPAEVVTKEIADALDMILIMTVIPGECVVITSEDPPADAGPSSLQPLNQAKADRSLCPSACLRCVLRMSTPATLSYSSLNSTPSLLQVVKLRELYPTINIQVDGGVGPATVEECAQAGSNVIVAGSAIFGAKSSGEVIKSLRAAVDDAIEKRKTK